MNDTRNMKKDKNQHIQVFVRVRPINQSEKVGKSIAVLELPSNKEVVVHERQQGTHSKKFTFDKVFGPSSKQMDVYNAVVSPLLEEVLAGYNCTVFAYGQTGTGKTFTMEGCSNDPTLHWQSDTSAGIIPRALSHLFDELRMLEMQEYTVRVSFLELYNEELFDLLSPNDDASKIRLYEDATRKGSVIIHGLEEVTVHNKNEVYKILEKGSEKRQTAATLMNAHSSRSHTVFSITIHIKENNVDGEELLKTGKLNLVDLAGSENVGRSGAVDRRAREAGNINQSLLTLGRVITALVERAPHIPYRESKLTRLLQESLGGRTKTSIIATVSPASINLEETLSTLDYAHRAKNITNRPEINQKLSKKALLKEYTEEIERLRRDLLAARERNGVYLAQENYNEMQTLIEHQTKEIEEKITHIKVLKETMENKEQIFTDLQAKHEEQTNHLHETKEQLETTTHALKSTEALLQMTEREKEEQSHLVEKHLSTEKQLLSQAQKVLDVAEAATFDVNKLHDKISHKRQLEQENEHISHQFRSNVTKQFQDMKNNVTVYTREFIEFCTSMKSNIDSQMDLFKKDIDSIICHMSDDIVNKEKLAMDEFTKNIRNSYEHYHQWLDTEMARSSDMTQREREFLNNTSLKLTSKINHLIEVNNMEIVKNLHHLKNDVSKKFDQLLAYTNESIKQLCNCRLQECDNLYKNINEIKQDTQAMRERDGKIMEEREKFKKSFENVWLQFNKLNENVTENYSVTCATLNHVDKVCDSTTNDILNNHKKAVERNETLQQKIQDDVNILKSDVESGMEKNWTLAEQIAVHSHNLVDELQTDLNNHCDALMQNKLHVEDNMKHMEQKLKEDNTSFIGSVKNIYSELAQGSQDHKKLGEELRKKNLQSFTELNDKLMNESKNASAWNDETLTELHSIHERVGKFLQDLRHDVPTGSTPARKEYQYPRNFIATSPHERIIQRFRETRNYLDNSDNEETILVNNNSPKKKCPNAN
ncbi:PREDICTED: bipolar kinesin KRP-130-like [Wasmannia auropunctata]|uniref:bipolar kinesin KRP-130-like n=1 Tax=Wasmannia auropunctata TaxID=64793 RepID=UPI0005F04E91|nr:PREDICTED: bipolar kinesin KRP-130-like [Wasmannia auropunctata]